MKHFEIEKGKAYPLGASVYEDGINFSAVLNKQGDCGIVLISKENGQKTKIAFSKGHRIGNIASVYVKGIQPDEYDYRFYCGEEESVDPYSKRIIGNEQWGIKEEPITIRSGFVSDYANWENDEPLCIPYEDSIIYCLHVRGFTVHPSSGVVRKGTYGGICEKIRYLNKLGITAIEMLPAYEFEEYKIQDSKETVADMTKDSFFDESVPKINYWGFQKGFYFAPKASYAYGTDACLEMKEMIKTLHRNGIEVIMQFYFPDGMKQGFIHDVIRYWVTEYHIDGVHLKGNRLPITLLGTEPLLENTKILYDYIPQEEIYSGQEKPIYRNLCVYSDDFMYQMRRFLKGDEDQLLKMLALTKRNYEKYAGVNFITNYYGFSLMDLVSYDKKHNEANGEQNKDGSNYNFSWNCGIEGKTRKTAILNLRKKMMKNAFLLVLLSQGTPVLTAGDEFANSQAGNNNPYCQDNEITWLNWKHNKTEKEILAFTRDLITFRKEQKFLHSDKEMSMLDRSGCGYPDMSYHGVEAWKAELENYNRHIGLMYSTIQGKEISLVYVAYNMHWEEKCFSLPSLPKGKKWKCVISSGCVTPKENSKQKTESYAIEERSIAVFVSD